jgi:hypothetical protein
MKVALPPSDPGPWRPYKSAPVLSPAVRAATAADLEARRKLR